MRYRILLAFFFCSIAVDWFSIVEEYVFVVLVLFLWAFVLFFLQVLFFDFVGFDYFHNCFRLALRNVLFTSVDVLNSGHLKKGPGQ